MVKQRFSTADLAAEVGTLRRELHGMRVTNVFDISSRVYVVLASSPPSVHVRRLCSAHRLAHPGCRGRSCRYAFKLARGKETGEKAILLIESGTRLHTVDELPDKPDTPSNFVLKLRKHVRSRRLEDIRQLGSDRVCQMTFGSGEHEVKILLEFFASGNIILVDPKYSVLSLLRSHRDDAKGLATMSQHTYPIQTIKLRRATEADDFRRALEASLSDPAGKTTLKDAVAAFLAYGPQAASFCIRRAGLDPKRREPLGSGTDGGDGDFFALLQQVWAFEKWVDSCEDTPAAGCIFIDARGRYQDFQPLVDGEPIIELGAGMTRLDFATFDDAVREFFSKIHGDRAASQIKQQESAARKKLEAIRMDHALRIENLNKEVDVAERKASVLQCSLSEADAAMDSVREALAAGFSWGDLEEMIEEEKQSDNPVATIIHSLHLERNSISLLLKDVDSDLKPAGDVTGHGGKMIVEVDLGLSSAHANVQAYFELRKKLADKARRTLESNDKALTAAEKNVLVKLRKIQEAKLEQAAGGKGRVERKPYWFEKFHWFISSENYLVVSGRDAQQNDLLVRRYLRKGDAYVHAELHGASSTVVKNNDPSATIPLMTLCEAGQACVAWSSAWDAKVTAAAYWVHPDQVSKTAPSGEYLTTGSMMIRGKKNYLPVSQLVMGLGWLFKLEESSVAGHLGERRVRDVDGAGPDGANGAAAVGTARETMGPGKIGEIGETGDPGKSALERFLEGSNVEEYSITATSTAKPRKKAPKADGAAGSSGNNENKYGRDLREEIKDVSTRTKKKKQRKQSKYQDQDEDERELARAFLASGGEKKNRDRKARKELNKAKMTARKMAASGIEQAEVTVEGIAELTRRLGKVVDVADVADGSDGSEDAEIDASAEEDEFQKESGQSTSRMEDGAGEADGPAPSQSEHQPDQGRGPEQEDEDFTEQHEVNILDQLTGLPRPGDELLCALPVVAPYTTLSSYKYSIKLLPGTQKKGKAYKQAIELIKAKFRGSAETRELSLMEAISLEDGINAMLGAVSLQAAGMHKIRQQHKDRKKASKAETKVKKK